MWYGRVLSNEGLRGTTSLPISVFLINASVNDGHSRSSFMGLEYSSLLTPLIFSLPCPPQLLPSMRLTHTEDAQTSLHYAVCHDG